MNAITRQVMAWNSGLAKLLILALLLTPFAGIIPPVQAAVVSDTTTYSFPNLVSNPNDPNWSIVEKIPSEMRLTATSFQMITNQTGADVNGEKLTIQFQVPASGYYDLNLTGWKNSAGGKADILVDNQMVSPAYSFYASTQTDAATSSLAADMYLSKGAHTLTFLANETTKLASNSRYYLYLYLTNFQLVLKQTVQELSELRLASNKSAIVVGNQAQLTLTTLMTDGTSIPHSQLESVTYTSSDDTIATVIPTSTGATVTGAAPGSAIITATATYQGVSRQGQISITVESANAITYLFNKLPSSVPYDPNWHVADKNPTTMNVTATSIQMINNAAVATVNGQFIKMNFYVPESGYYDVMLNSFKNSAGGKADILLDNQVVSSAFNFYNSTSQAPSVSKLADFMELRKGMHTITFSAVETVKLPSNSRYYLYLYLTDLKLNLRERIVELKEVSLETSKTRLAVGDSLPATVTGKLSNGQPADLSVADNITYSSSNSGVVTINGSGTSATITAVGLGQADLTASVTLNGVTETKTVRFIVGESIKYNFKEPVTSKLEETGWEIVDSKVPPGTSTIRHQEYGIQVQATEVGQYVTFDILVPETGIYTVNLNGAGASSGAVASLLIDGEEVGDYNFYNAAYIKEKGQVAFRTLELSSGVHKLTLKVKQRAGYFHMYPGELELVQVEKMPALVSAALETNKQELMVGQTAKLAIRGTLSDSFTYNLNKVQSADKTFTSSDPAIAVVSNDGTVTAKQPGAVTIQATVVMGGVSKSASVNMAVNDKVLEIVDVTADKTQLTTGKTAKLTVAGKLADGTAVDISDAVVVYSSSDSNAASVSQQGDVTALAIGTTSVAAVVTLGDTTVRGTVTIEVIAPILESITAKLTETSLFVGDNRKIYVNGLMNSGDKADLSLAEITYTSSAPQVAVIENGFVKVKQQGTADLTISVKLGTVTKTASITITATDVTSSKTRTTYYSAAKVEAARHNADTYNWADSERDGAVSKAEKYLALGHEALWNAVTPQSIPRGYAVNQAKGSPVTGLEINKYGNYPYSADPINEPWKITDPSSGYKFPTNDFGAYYKSGLDPNGTFDPKLADRSLLVNTLYPEKGPTWGVDDGYGWVDESGNRYTFIAYYTHWHLWHGGLINQAITSFRDAYVYTGDIKYARAGTILLDRIADVYPDMDTSQYAKANGFLNSDGGTGMGKVIGSIWETGLVREYLSAYDAFFPAMDDAGAIAFLSGKADQYDLSVLKKSAAGIKRNIEDGIIRQIYPGVQSARIHGNNGMHQSTLAMAAVVMDTLPETKEWLDFNFQAGGLVSGPYRVTGGNISTTLVNDVDRDGAGNEASPEYNKYWLGAYQNVADILDGYDKYPVADLYQNVKFQKMYSAQHPLMLSDVYTALIGDAGTTGGPINYLDKAQYIKAFEKFGSPIYAQLAYYLNGNQSSGIHSNIYSANPEAIAAQIEQVIQEHGPLKLESGALHGYGFAALRDGENMRRFSGVGFNFSQLEITEATTNYQVFENSGTLQFNAESVGQKIGFAFDVPKTDTYEVNLRPFKAASYGIYQIKIDGVPVRTLDFSGSSGASSKVEVIANLPLSEGRHVISFEGVGKGEGATNYKLGVIQLQLFDEAAQAVKNDPNNVNTMRDAWIYYGRNTGHGHKDTLNLGMHAYGLDLLPELGYPEFADFTVPRRSEWENHTISHNTVLVDRAKQGNQVVGQPAHFDDTDRVKLIDVAAADSVYPQTDLYKRTTAMIKVDPLNSYTVDFFRVKGGNDHHFSFHSAEATVTTEGLNLTPQATGSYAGPDVAYGVRPSGDSVAGSGYMGSGFHFLKNVAKDMVPVNQFSVDWNVKDTWDIYGNGAKAPTDVHLRLTMLSDVSDVSLADGIPPTNKPGNPASLRYMIAHRTGTNLQSNFASVIEPYKGERYVDSIQAVSVKANGVVVTNELEVKAVKVQLKNGRTDYIVSSMNPGTSYLIDDKVMFQGLFGVYSEQDGRQVYGYVQEGSVIGRSDSPLITNATSNVTGTVTDFTKTLSMENTITVAANLNGVDLGELRGRTIYIQNDGTRNAAYTIQSVTDLGGGQIKLGIGDITTIRSYVDSTDFSKGFKYDLAVGALFSIPLSVEAELIETTATVTGEQKQSWYTGNTSVVLSVYHNPANILRTEYSLDEGANWIPYSEPIQFNENGEHTLMYRSVSRSGTTETAQTLQIRIDRLAPSTTVEVNGALGLNGWHISDSSVILTAVDTLSGVESTQYSLTVVQSPQASTVTQSTYGPSAQTPTPSTQGYVPYTGAIQLSEGVYTLQFKSKDVAGNIEQEQQVTVKVDKTAPSMALLANGTLLTEGAAFTDVQPITLTLQSDDNLSGVEAATIRVDNTAYAPGSPLDWAGKLGAHEIVVTMTDKAGNRTEILYHVIVNATLDSLIQLLSRYEAENQLSDPLVNQLGNAADQAKHHYDMGISKQAIKHLEDLLKHLNNDSMQGNVSAAAKAAIKADVSALIASWSNLASGE